MAARKKSGSRKAASRKHSPRNGTCPKRASQTRAKKEEKSPSTTPEAPRRTTTNRSGVSADLQRGGYQVVVRLHTDDLGAAQILYSCQEPQSRISVRRHVAELLGGNGFQIDQAYLRDRRHPARQDWEVTSII